ncbi:response regulator [Salinispora oceanensis]|uniref:response regulator n=1 Tax=Salinispora oceanensis TaxID=1050199 RepID=UPI0003618F62|nr:response regulator transcription factor [Salinispora oceanensis]
MAGVIKVLVVDDDALVRVGLSAVLNAAEDIEVVAEAADGADAVAVAQRLRPDVVLMDIRMPGLDGLSATAAVRSLDEPPAVIVLTTFNTDDHILRALRAGANGFLLKDMPPRQIQDSVRAVAAGESMLSPAVVERLIDYVVQGADNDGHHDRVTVARAALAHLTKREREVAAGVAAGRSNAEIGGDLFMSVATVKVYVSRIMAKLDCANRVQVAILVHQARE